MLGSLLFCFVFLNRVCLCFICRNLSTSSLYCLRGRQTVANIVNIRMAGAEDGKLTNSTWVGFDSSQQDLLQWKIKYPNLFAAALRSSTGLQAQVNFYSACALSNKVSGIEQITLTSGLITQGHRNLSWVCIHPHMMLSTRESGPSCYLCLQI